MYLSVLVWVHVMCLALIEFHPWISEPYSPQNLRVVSKSTESLTVHWSAPSRGKVDAYLIKFSTQSVAASSLPQVKLQPNQLEFSQDGLTAGVTYTVNVFVEISTRESDRTEQSYPAVLAVTMSKWRHLHTVVNITLGNVPFLCSFFNIICNVHLTILTCLFVCKISEWCQGTDLQKLRLYNIFDILIFLFLISFLFVFRIFH